jgi:uncharacterized protein YndB with AHSA1/START domain
LNLAVKGGQVLTVTKSVLIERPVADVWEFLTDLTNTPKWDVGVTETRVTSNGPPGLATTFTNDGQWLGRQSVREYVVKEYEPGRKVTVEMMAPPGSIQWASVSYAFEPADGGTRLTALGQVQFRGFFKLLEPMLLPRATRDFEGDLANLKRLLEAK